MTISIAPAAPVSPPQSTVVTQQLGQLNQLVSQYKLDVTKDTSTQSLSALANQIGLLSNLIGQHVVLPRQAGGALGVSAVAGTTGGTVNLTA